MRQDLTGQEEILLARLCDFAEDCDRQAAAKFIGFLDEHQRALAEEALREIRFFDYRFDGGYPDAGRAFLCMYPSWFSEEERTESPVRCCHFSFRTCDVLTHRDFLGSLMALGIKRETVGDILVREGQAVVFTTENVARMIVNDVRKIGRVGVKISVGSCDLSAFEQQFEDFSGTVSSLRLDCVLSFLTGLSREKSLALIRAKNVSIHHMEATEGSCPLHEKDLLSVRGYGRFLLDQVGDLTKKGKWRITVKKYL